MNQLPDFLKPLESLTQPFPTAAVERVVANREEAIPYLVSALERAASSPPEEIADDYMLHIYALFLLGQFRDVRGYLPAVKLAGNPQVDALLRDVVTGGLSEALASMSGGDPRPVQTLLEDREADEWARGAGGRALGAMFHGGMISREDFTAYLGGLFSGKLERNLSHVWDILVTMCGDFRLAEHLDAIRKAFEEGLADPGYEPLENLEKRIFFKELDEFDMREYRLIDSAVDQMSWWACFNRDEALKERRLTGTEGKEGNENWKEETGQFINAPVRREAPKVGRNDPCPCGSGKKYKKCCLN